MNEKFEEDKETEDIKANVKEEDVRKILGKRYGITEAHVSELYGYDDRNFLCRLHPVSGPQFVLKIMNSLDSKKSGLCEAQNSIMLFFDRQGNIPCPVPVPNVLGKYCSKEKLPWNSKGKEHMVRLLTYIPGTLVKNVEKSYSLFRELGLALAHFDQVLKGFYNSFYESHSSIWHLRSAPKLLFFLDFVENEEKKKLVETVVKRFSEEILPTEMNRERGIIHGDFNEHNVLMSESEDKEWKVVGILDFGDSHVASYLFEVAVALCYAMFEAKRHGLSPVTAAGHFLAGYLSVGSLPGDFPALKLCVCTRICQSLVLGLRAFKQNPKNQYVLDSQSIGWPLLEELYHTSDQQVTDHWNKIISTTM